MDKKLFEQIKAVSKDSMHSANARFQLCSNGDVRISVANNGQSAEFEVQNLVALRTHIEQNANINGLYASFVYATGKTFYFFLTR